MEEGAGRHMSIPANVVLGSMMEMAVRYDAMVVNSARSTTPAVTVCAIRPEAGAK